MPLPSYTIRARVCRLAGPKFRDFPGRASARRRGPYRLIRHPAYAGECLMALPRALAGGRWLLALIPAVALAFVLRICAEESVLSASPEYRKYADAVRWRLLPGVW